MLDVELQSLGLKVVIVVKSTFGYTVTDMTVAVGEIHPSTSNLNRAWFLVSPAKTSLRETFRKNLTVQSLLFYFIFLKRYNESVINYKL